MKIQLAVLVILSLELNAQVASYDSTLVVDTNLGQLSIQSIEPEISCNDKGETGFIATFPEQGTGVLIPGVFVADKDGVLRHATPSVTSANSQGLGPGVHLTESDAAVVRRYELVSAPTPIPFSYVDSFDTLSGTRTNLVTAAPLIAQFDGIRGHVGASSSGNVVFIPFNGSQQNYGTLSQSGAWNVNTTFLPDPAAIADNENFVFLRDGTAVSIVPASSFPGLTVWTVADASSGFSNLTTLPGISDQGDAVAFSGTRNGSVGVYAAVRLAAIAGGAQAWQTFRVAGEGVDDIVDVDLGSRVVVQTIYKGATSATLTVAFSGTSQVGGQSPSSGVFSVDALVVRNPVGSVDVSLGEPSPVVLGGATAGGNTIAETKLYDSMNRAGEVHTHVSFTNGGTGIVRSVRRVPELEAIRVSAMRALDGSGLPSPQHGWNHVLEAIAHARSLLALANLELRLVAVEDVPDPAFGTPASLYAPVSTAAAEVLARVQNQWRDDAINLVLCDALQGGSAGQAGYPEGFGPAGSLSDVIFAAGQSDPVRLGATIAHEICHYLGLQHTFETALGTETGPGILGWPSGWTRAPNGAVAGDLVADTLPDPYTGSAGTAEELAALATCAAWYGSTPITTSVVRNLMSRYSLGRDQLSVGQGVRMHMALHLARSHVLDTGLQDSRNLQSRCGSRPAFWMSPPRAGVSSDFWFQDFTPGTLGVLLLSLPAPPFSFAPDCFAHVDVANLFVFFFTPMIGTAFESGWTPPSSAIAGTELHWQAAMFQGPVLEPSNGVAVTIGS